MVDNDIGGRTVGEEEEDDNLFELSFS